MKSRMFNNTMKNIVDAFVEMYSAGPLENIKIQQLCNRAGIARSTFYYYFEDVYDLCNKLEDCFIEQVKNNFDLAVKMTFENDPFRPDYDGFIKACTIGLNEIKKEKELYKALLSGSYGRRLQLNLRIKVAQKFEQHFDNTLAKDMGEQCCDSFYASGIVSLLDNWIDHSCEGDVHELCESLSRIFLVTNIYRLKIS